MEVIGRVEPGAETEKMSGTNFPTHSRTDFEYHATHDRRKGER